MTLVILKHAQAFARHTVPQTRRPVKRRAMRNNELVSSKLPNSNTYVASISCSPSVVIGHHAIELTVFVWPLSTTTSSFGGREYTTSSMFHIRAVRSSEHDAIRVREGLHLI